MKGQFFIAEVPAQIREMERQKRAKEIAQQREQQEIDERTKLLSPDQKKSWVDGYNAAKEKARAEESCCIIL